ncbi:hypothetical protein TNCV_2978191 [Trichonephila clavipes]|nr:hypothetical protein TNCV_2978191 [Trichonephila clavipes]
MRAKAYCTYLSIRDLRRWGAHPEICVKLHRVPTVGVVRPETNRNSRSEYEHSFPSLTLSYSANLRAKKPFYSPIRWIELQGLSVT